MKFKRLIALLLSATLLLLTACTPEVSKSSDDSDKRDYTRVEDHWEKPPFDLEGAVNASTHIVYATVEDVYKINGVRCAIFRSVRSLKGDIPDHHTFAVHSFFMRTFFFEDNYLLFLRLYSSVYYDQDMYTYHDDLVLPSYDRDAYTTPPVSEEEASVIDYLAEHPTQPEAEVDDFIRSDKLEDIVEGSPLIVRVRANNFAIGNGEQVAALYAFELLETLKGTYNTADYYICDSYGDRIFNGIEIYCNTEDITLGSEYIVMIGRERHSSKFRISSRNSVYAVEDTQTIEKIRQLLTA